MNPIIEIARQCSYKSFQGVNILYYRNVNLFHTKSDSEFDDALNDLGGIQDGENEPLNNIQNRMSGREDLESVLGAIRNYLNEERARRYKEDLEKAEDMILN